MRPGGAVLDLSAGAAVVLDGSEWTVERREPHLGRVHLVGADGARQRVSLRFLANRTRRDLQASLALARPGSTACVPMLAHLSAVESELAERSAGRPG